VTFIAALLRDAAEARHRVSVAGCDETRAIAEQDASDAEKRIDEYWPNPTQREQETL
jgi:hypothetical protein